MTVTMNTCEKKNHHQTNGSKVLINTSNYLIAKIIRTDSRAVELKRLLDGYRHTTYGTVGITCQGNVVCDAFLNHILFLKDKLHLYNMNNIILVLTLVSLFLDSNN